MFNKKKENILANIENLKEVNESLTDEILKELLGVNSLTQVIYGDTHWKLAWSHINIALIYLEHKHLAKQAKHHCERAFQIYTEDLKEQQRRNLFLSGGAEDGYDHSEEFYNPDECRHQMILNFVFGKSCTILKE